MFAPVISAFTIQIHSQLQLNPNEETATLLRVLYYKPDNIYATRDCHHFTLLCLLGEW